MSGWERAPPTIRDLVTTRRDLGLVVLTLLAALAIPIATATILLSRKRGYRPTFVPGGPLPRRRPTIDERVGVA